MARRNRSTDTINQEDTMTETPTTNAPEAASTEFDEDVQLDENFEDVDIPEDDEVEDIPDAPEGSTTAGTAKAKEPAKPKRGDLEEGLVTPIQFAKVLGEKGLHTNK